MSILRKLPPEIKAKLAKRIQRPAKKKPAMELTPAARRYFQEQGRRGGHAQKREDKARGGRSGGVALREKRIAMARQICAENGINYDELPEVPK